VSAVRAFLLNAVTPTPGRDAQWLAFCPACDESELCVSVGGLRDGGVCQCYMCGTRRKVKGLSQVEIDRMILSCQQHWKKFPVLPLDWHLLSEDDKWRHLGITGNVDCKLLKGAENVINSGLS
jgi:hypothetical protein